MKELEYFEKYEEITQLKPPKYNKDEWINKKIPDDELKQLPSFEFKKVSKEEKINNAQSFKPKKKEVVLKAILFMILVPIVLALMLYVFKAGIILTVVVLMAMFPLFFLGNIFGAIMLYIKRHKIKNFVVKKLSKRYIKAYIYSHNKRLLVRFCILNKDGKTFNWNGGLYILDKEAIWYDEDNHPCTYYLENLPNPIIFQFSKDIAQYVKDIIAQNKVVSKDDDGVLIDVAFSSINLQKFKQEKIFEDFMRNPAVEKMMYFALALIGLAFITIILMVLFMK